MVWPISDFVELTSTLPAQRRLQSHSFSPIILHGAGAMRIDISNLGWRQVGPCQRLTHRPHRPFSIGWAGR